MISVCIPVYNYDVVNLVTKIRDQILISGKEAEVVLIDDGSTEYFKRQNSQLTVLPFVKYREQPNAGRSITRNRLVEMATYDHLIFLDCDCDVPDLFIQKYMSVLPFEGVVIGGLAYYAKPHEPEFHLRWKVGIHKEVKSLEQRQKNPYANFLSSNFMISKSIIKELNFDVNLKGYGHEDTLFGATLKKKNIPVLHVENQVYHLGLDPVSVYLCKLRQSVDNFVYIINAGGDVEDIKLLHYYFLINKLHLVPILFTFFKSLIPILERYLLNFGTNLFLLDLYKLGVVCLKMNQIKTVK